MSKTFAMSDYIGMMNAPLLYPDAKLAETLLVEPKDIKGRWLKGKESEDYFNQIIVKNENTEEQVNKEAEEKSQ